MIIQMNDVKIETIKDMKEFLKTTERMNFRKNNQEEAYKWINKILIKFEYLGRLKKSEKGVVKKYIIRMTGYSRAQATRLIKQYARTGYIKAKQQKRHKFNKKYTDEDVKLLAHTDKIHNYPNGNALKNIVIRMHKIYKHKEFENLSNISVSHIYNLRESSLYKHININYQKTKPNVRNIGERRKPMPEGKPGYLRVDTVHQGDRDGEKGVYHINTIDEVTQFEFVGSCPYISERYLKPLLEKLLELYPFIITEFHSDNGSEFINKVVCDLLNKMLIGLTKSRARKTNDNALVEGKNGSIIRKWIGYGFIGKEYAGNLNHFYSYFNEYLNFHRPCGFSTEERNEKGKVKKVYKKENYMTPYEKFRSLDNCQQYLKKGITLTMLDKTAMRYSDNQLAVLIQEQLVNLTKEVLPDYFLSLKQA